MLTEKDLQRIVEIGNGLHEKQKRLSQHRFVDPEPNWRKLDFSGR